MISGESLPLRRDSCTSATTHGAEFSRTSRLGVGLPSTGTGEMDDIGTMVSFTGGSDDVPADHRGSGRRRGRGGGVSISPRRMGRLLLAAIFVVGDRWGGGSHRQSFCHAVQSSASSINQGVPGSIHTDSGYDTEMGVDPICWVTENGKSLRGTGGAVPLEGNKLVSEFYLPLEPIQLLRSCPPGVSLTGAAPPDLASVISGKITYRTGDVVPYRVRVSIPDPSDLPGGGERFVSDKLPFVGMQVQIVLCLAGEVGFCSPYVHEHANARLERLNLTQSVPRGDRHAGTHVHAYGDFVPLEGSDATSGASREVDVVVPVLVNDPGDFFAIAAVQMFTANATHPKTPAYKYDIANALENRLISYQDPAEILTVTTGVRIATVTIVAIAATLEAALLAYGVTHRESKVMQLCQGRFLIAFLLSALVATMGSMLFEPRSDLFCTLRGPLVFIPLQLMYAITAGRLWRINAVISPLLKSSMRRVEDSLSSRFCDFLTFMSSTGPLGCAAALLAACNLTPCLGRSSRSRRGRRSIYQKKESKLRVTVTSWQLAKVVAFFSMPMIVVQVLGAFLDTKTLDVRYNLDESVGEAYCRASDGGVIGAFDIASLALFFSLFLILLVMAYESRDLPSLLNETEKIYSGALFTLFVIALGIFVIAITSTSVTTPDAQYVLSVAMVIAITLNMSFSIMLPKYQVIHDGDYVMVSKLVSDHRERSTNSQTNPHSASSRISTNELSSSSVPRNSDGTKIDVPSGDSPNEDCNDENGVTSPCPITGKKTLAHRFSSCLGNGRDSRMVISEVKAPPRTLLLRMVDANESLEELNKRIMSGMAINRQEWEELREILVDVGHTFRERVRFEWDEDSSVERAAIPAERSSTTNHLEGKAVSNCAFANPAA